LNMLSKRKVFHNTKFSPEIIKKANDILAQFIGESETATNRYEIKNKEERWEFENEDEFFSEYRNPNINYANLRKNYQKNKLSGYISLDYGSEFFFDFVSKVRRSCVQFPAVCLIPAPLPLPYSRNNTPTAPFLQVLSSLCAAA